MHLCVRACMHGCVGACVRAWVRPCARTHVCVCVCTCMLLPIILFTLCSHYCDSCVSQPLHSAGPDRGSALLRSVGDYEEEVGCLCVYACVCVHVFVCVWCVCVCFHS